MQRWLRRLLGVETPTKPRPALEREAPPNPPNQAHQAQEYLDRVHAKITRLAEEFAAGSINRAQFNELFEHYQRERRTIESWLDSSGERDDWRKAASEGKSVIIRRRFTAGVLGYAIYENDSGMPLSTIGKFEIDPALAVPMLSSFRSATAEIFGGGVQSTQIEGGRWMCFVPGEMTTLMALFTTEPATQQVKLLEEIHRLFERANRPLLLAQPVNPDILVFPHEQFLGRAF